MPPPEKGALPRLVPRQTTFALKAASVAAVEDADTVSPTGAWDFDVAPTVNGVALGPGDGGTTVPEASTRPASAWCAAKVPPAATEHLDAPTAWPLPRTAASSSARTCPATTKSPLRMPGSTSFAYSADNNPNRRGVYIFAADLNGPAFALF